MILVSFFRIDPLVLAQDVSASISQSNSVATTQDNSGGNPSLLKNVMDLRLGPFDLHPRLTAEMLYDDNILLSTANKEADGELMIQPALQAVAGDDAALIEHRDRHSDIISLSPGNLIVQQLEGWPGKLLILDYGPRFQIFDKYTANNSLDQFATGSLLWPMDKLILGFRQDYQSDKEEIIEAGERAIVETIPTIFSAAYQFGDKTSMESDFRRISVDYATPGLVGYTEYNTEDWFNYKLTESLPVSLGGLAGMDQVANHQDQTYEQLRARARYFYTQKLTFDASVGGELRQYQNGNPSTLNPIFTVTGELRPTERTWLRLTAYRQLYASIFNGYNYANTGATLDVGQGITDRFSADISVGYYDVDYTTVTGPLISHQDGYYTARINLDAKIVRHLNGQLFCQWVNRQSPFNGNFNDDQVGLQLILSY
jgi:hypothetical protein